MKLLKFVMASILSVNLMIANDIIDSDKNYISDKINQFQQDVKNDGLNLRFKVNLYYLDPERSGRSFHEALNRRLLLSGGVMLLPNTWKISVSYTRQIKDNIKLAGGESEYSEVENIHPSYIYEENIKPISWIDIYMKPISQPFGEIGFGYMRLEHNAIQVIEPHYSDGDIKVLDVAGNDGNAYKVNAGDTAYARYNELVQKFYTTYNVPKTDSWYDGFGVKYEYELSNRTQEAENEKNVILKPTVKTNIFSIGFNKILDEIDTGFCFKTLSVGKGYSNIYYYNYDTKRNEKISKTFNQLTIEAILIKKFKSNRKIYIAGKLFSKFNRLADITGNSDDEINGIDQIRTIEIGILF